MATPHHTKIDVPLMLWRINPAGEYHWKGNGWGTYADIGEWRSPDVPKPTEEQIYAEWDKHLIEQEQIKIERDMNWKMVIDRARSAENTPVNALTHEQTQALLVLLLMKFRAIDEIGTIKPLETWAQLPP